MDEAGRYPTDSWVIHLQHEWHEELDVVITDKDKKILRELAKQTADIAALPVQKERKNLWNNMINLKDTRPMIWMCDVCWNEMKIGDELTLQTSSKFCRNIETDLRRILYSWKHMPGDMVVEPVVYSPIVYTNSGYGIETEENTVETDQENTVVSHQFKTQIKDIDDIEKIKMPEISYKTKKTEENYQAYCDIFNGILEVKKRGIPGFWFSMWDTLVSWTGVQDILLDLAMRPEYIHKLVDHFMNVSVEALDQYEKLNLLSPNNNNTRIGSGAYGYTNELPKEGFNPEHVRAKDIWGCAADQILTEVSPAMHDEFAMKYDLKWLSKFGLTHYGCCESLHNKIDMLKTIPNLRRVSCSPWTDLTKAAPDINGDYVLSIKVSPTILAEDKWHPEIAREEIRTKMKLAKENNCQAEVIMKDISTVHYEPQRLWEWAKIAKEEAQKYA